MSTKKLYLVSLLVVGLVAMFVVGCDQADKTVNSVPTISDDGSTGQDPPGAIDGVVTDTVIDYTDEIRSIAPWMLDSSNTVTVAYRLSSDPRMAVVLEAIYAVAGPDWRVTKAINGCAVSDWNYLASDLSAYNYIKSAYGSNASVWGVYYSDPVRYGFYGSMGKFGQCRGAANGFWYRGADWHHTLYSYSYFTNDYNGAKRYTKPYYKARRGDIIQYAKNGKYHTAVVVAILAGTEG